MLRWSWRDLRRRRGLVVLTALIIAIGTGTYAGFGGSTPWRLASQDASYAALQAADLRVRVPVGTDVPQGTLADGIAAIEDAELVVAVEERLIVTTQVDASTDGTTVLVPGEVFGLPLDADVSALWLAEGRLPEVGAGEVVADVKFVSARSLPATGELTISGGRRVRYVGTGTTPENFYVLGDGTSIAGAYGYANLYTSVADAQELTGRPGRVNDAVLRLAPGADPDAVAAQVSESLADVGATVETQADDPVRRAIYADASNDEKTWTALSLLILFGASFASFNLISRMVEAERHEIGVAMALGAPVRRLAIRPLLVGAQIAVAGAVIGLGVGALAGWLMRDLLVSLLPLPVWSTPFPFGRYLQAALLGVALPMIATVIPVARALRVDPVDALRPAVTGGSARRAAGFAPLLRRFRWRGRIVATMPVRNVMRSPRRTVLTALGIGASITALVAVLGMLDSVGTTFQQSDAELAGTSPDRLEVALSTFTTADDPRVAAIAAAPEVRDAQPILRIGGTLRHGDEEVETLLDVLDLETSMWVPTASSGQLPVGEPGLVISQKAAADLDVAVGDRIALEHPVREGTGYRMVETDLPVAAVHPNPLRFFTYVDASQTDLFQLEGIVNQVLVRPSEGTSADEVKRALFVREGVGSVQEVAVLGQLLADRLGQFTGLLRAMQGFTLALALLIALNSATLTMEERRREQATMFAFGLPVRTVLRTIVVETGLTAVLGTVIGIFGGLAALGWLLDMFTTETFPELGVVRSLTTGSVVATLVLGVGVASAAPVLAVRRLLRTDIPSTLRVLE